MLLGPCQGAQENTMYTNGTDPHPQGEVAALQTLCSQGCEQAKAASPNQLSKEVTGQKKGQRTIRTTRETSGCRRPDPCLPSSSHSPSSPTRAARPHNSWAPLHHSDAPATRQDGDTAQSHVRLGRPSLRD